MDPNPHNDAIKFKMSQQKIYIINAYDNIIPGDILSSKGFLFIIGRLRIPGFKQKQIIKKVIKFQATSEV